MNIFELRSIAKSFRGKPVIQGLNLALAAGEHLVLTGPSGGGKTTLLRMIAGLESCDIGSIQLEGRVATQLGKILVPPHQRGIAMVFQDLGLWPNLSIRDNVLLGLSGLKLSRAERITRVDQALNQCEIQKLSNFKPSRLSGGEQQRAALARALALRPRLLLLDEPFNGIDLVLRQSLLNQMLSVARDAGSSILWTSHHPQDALRLNAKVAVLEGGQLLEIGFLEKLFENPHSQTMKAWRVELGR